MQHPLLRFGADFGAEGGEEFGRGQGLMVVASRVSLQLRCWQRWCLVLELLAELAQCDGWAVVEGGDEVLGAAAPAAEFRNRCIADLRSVR
jgi:hypothetical protein